MSKSYLDQFIPLNIAILTISDTRNEETDTSGLYIKDAIIKDKHKVVHKSIVKDDIADIQNILKLLSQREDIDIIISTGGTGFTKRDNTKVAVMPLLEKTIDGFGELFRYFSYQEIGTSTIQSNAFAGIINKKIIFCIPGSTGACKTAYEKILAFQLNSTTKPCNFAALIKHNYI